MFVGIFICVPIEGREHLDGTRFDLILNCLMLRQLDTGRRLVLIWNEIILEGPRVVMLFLIHDY